MKRFFALLLALFTVFLCACQPTPEDEPVPNKGDDVMGEKIHTTPVPKTSAPASTDEADAAVTDEPFIVPHLDVPEHWTETIECGVYDVDIDVDIEYEDCAHPVYVIRDREGVFDSEIAHAMLDKFTQQAMWRPVGSTREEILEELERVMRGHVVSGVDVMPGEEEYEPYEGQQERIDELVKKLQEVDPDGGWESGGLESMPNGAGYIGDGVNTAYVIKSDRYLMISATDDNKLKYYTDKEAFEWMLDYVKPGEPRPVFPEPEMERERAVEIADALIAEVGLDGWLSVSRVKKGVALYNSREVRGIGWMVSYMLKSEGARMFDSRNDYQPYGPVNPNNYASDGGLGSSSDYRPRNTIEKLNVFVQDGEIKCIEWQYPEKLIGVANPAVELMPFDRIKESIRKRFRYGLAWANDMIDPFTGELQYKPHTQNLVVSEIALSYYKTGVKDDVSANYWAPVWAIIFSHDYSGDIRPPYITEFIIYINAIDGTFIEFNYDGISIG